MVRQDKTADIRAALQWAALRLNDCGIEQGRADAEIILGFSMGLSRVDLYLQPERLLLEHEFEVFRELLERRALREPVQYLTGVQEFMSLTFEVNREVLIPRADTEILVETALTWAKSQSTPLRILDLCTGSGAVAISLAHFLPQAELWAGDISPAALQMAKVNAAKLGATVHFRQGDLTSPFLDVGPFELITANPPYIPTSDILTLQPEVGVFEPKNALDGGKDGLDFYHRIAREVPDLLHPGGLLLLEIGWDQAQAVSEILSIAGFTDVEVKCDYAGRDRVVSAKAPATVFPKQAIK